MAERGRSGKRERKEELERLRREQRAADRRRTLLVVGVSGLLGVGLIAAALVPALTARNDDPARKAASEFGVPASQAGCDTVQSEPASGTNQHVAPGQQVDYATVPPSFGPHFGETAPPDRPFYTAADRPPMERLVHNLEHGYTIVWYDDTVTGGQREALEDLAKHFAGRAETRKFIVSAWDPAYGAFPQDRHVAVSHWGKSEGYRQLCGEVSGEAIADFVDGHPSSDSPEPFGA